jgi:hypothetical protein
MTAWAKAPRLNVPESRAEALEFLTGGLHPVDCDSCGNRVLVRKASAAQTSVQWLGDPAAGCPEFAARVAAGETSARIDTCRKLRHSIERAAAGGLLEVPDG